MYLVHAVLGLLIAIGAVVYLVRSRDSTRIVRLSGWIGSDRGGRRRRRWAPGRRPPVAAGRLRHACCSVRSWPAFGYLLPALDRMTEEAPPTGGRGGAAGPGRHSRIVDTGPDRTYDPTDRTVCPIDWRVHPTWPTQHDRHRNRRLRRHRPDRLEALRRRCTPPLVRLPAEERPGVVAGGGRRARVLGRDLPRRLHPGQPRLRALLLGQEGHLHLGPGRRRPRPAADAHAEHGPAPPHPLPPAGEQGVHPRMVNQLHDRINAAADRIIDSVIEQGTADFVTDIAAELPLVVIAELLGVPNEDRHRMFDWSNRMIGSEDPEYQTGEEASQQAAMELYAYASELFAAKRADPHDDLMSVLTGVDIEGEKLSGHGARAVLPAPHGGRQRDHPESDLRGDGCVLRQSRPVGAAPQRPFAPAVGRGGDAALRHAGDELPAPDHPGVRARRPAHRSGQQGGVLPHLGQP